MLSALLLIPIIGSLMLLPINEQSPTQSPGAANSVNGVTRMKQIALTASIVNFILSIVLWGEFDSSSVQYQFVQEFNNLSFCHLNIGIDGISLYFVLLTTFITPLCILANWDNIKFGIKYFLIAFLLMETLLIAVFVVLDLMLFYIFFESVLIPMFLVVGIWGGSVTRIRASFLLFLYTLAGSLFMLLSIMVIYYNVGSTDFAVVSLSELTLNGQQILWLGFFLSFAVKTPLVPLHIWLPRAHAEAPLGASILLASVFLKLAVYGFLRIVIPMLPDATAYFSPLVQTIAIVSLIYSSLATLRQHDLKALVAYSSVGHMAIVVLGLFSNTIVGIEGAILLSIAHGLVSPAMFVLVGGVLYDRFHTRTIRYYRGMAVYIPVFSALFFISTAFNMAVPLSLNWLGEIMSLTGMFQKSPIIRSLGALSIVLSASYSIYLFNRVAFGTYSQYLSYTTDVTRREFIILATLLGLALIFGIMPNIILSDLHVAVTTLIYNLNPQVNIVDSFVSLRVVISSTSKNINSFVRNVTTLSERDRVSKIFSYATVPDTGGDTDNPHILVRWFIARGGTITLEDLNCILTLTKVALMTSEEFRTLTAVKSTTYSLPFMGKQRTNVLGPVKSTNPIPGIYVFTAPNGDCRVGSAANQPKRLYEHFGQGAKSSSELNILFTLHGMKNITLTLYVLPTGTSYDNVQGLEQYYMMCLNPSHSSLKVVNNPHSSRGVTHKVYELTEQALLEARMKSGKPGYVYNREGVLLFAYQSIQHFNSLAATPTAGHHAIHRFLDTGKYYKGLLLITSTPNDCVSLPTMTQDQFRSQMLILFNTKYDLSNRTADPKSNPVVITGTTPTGQPITLHCKSGRNAVDQLVLNGITISRKRIDKLVLIAKNTNQPQFFSANGFSLTINLQNHSLFSLLTN